MNTAVLVTVQQQARPFVMQASEVGTNKPYIDLGLMQYEVQTTLARSIDSMIDYLSTKQFPLHLAVEGHTIALLEQFAYRTYVNLKSFVQQSHVRLVALPYHGSLSLTLTEQLLHEQLQAQQQMYVRHFGKAADYTLTHHPYCFEETMNIVHAAGEGTFALQFHAPTQSIHLESFTSVYAKETADVLIALDVSAFADSTRLTELAYALDTSTPVLIDTLAKSSMTELEPLPTDELFDHLKDEFMSIYPYIQATDDEQLKTDWALLAQPHAIYNTTDSIYEHYASYMNILNDMAHKLRSVALTQQGLFETEATLVDSPSAHVSEVFHLE